jgi:hypothetical protein
MERSVGVLKIAAIVAVVFASALGNEGGALQGGGTQLGAAPATSRTGSPPEGPGAAPARFSAETRRRAELERAWQEDVQDRCGAPSGLIALTPEPAAC